MYTRVLDGMQARLIDQSGSTLATQAWNPVIVYINGEYWGTYNIREAHSAEHYANHYGYNADTVTQWKEAWDSGSGFGEVYRFIQDNSLSVEENYNYVAEHLNIDSVIGWVILQAYCGNFDMHSPNMRFYYSTEDDMLTFALVDLDLGFFRYEMFDGPFHFGYAYNQLAYKLLQSPIFQKELARQLGEALTGAMSDENVLALIDQLADELRPEIARDREKWGGSLERWESMVQDLLDYVTHAGGRAKLMVNSLYNQISLTDAEKQEYFGDVK